MIGYICVNTGSDVSLPYDLILMLPITTNATIGAKRI